MIRYNARRKIDYDRNRIPPTNYYNGDEVWIDADERQVGDNAYTLRLSKSNKYVPVNVSQICKELPVEADMTKSNDGLTKSARSHIQTGKAVTAKYNSRKIKHKAKKRKRMRTTLTSPQTTNDTAEPHL